MAPTTKTKWSSVQEAAVLACAEHCVQQKLDLNSTIPNLMKAMEYSKPWCQISSKLSSLNKAHNRTAKNNSLALLRRDGLKCLDLPAGLAAQVDTARKALQDLFDSLNTGPSATTIVEASQVSANASGSAVDPAPLMKRSCEPDAEGHPEKVTTKKRSREPNETTTSPEHPSKRARSDDGLDIDNMEHSEVLWVDNESQVWNSEDRLALGLSMSETPRPTRSRRPKSVRRCGSVSPYQLRSQLKRARPKADFGSNERKELEDLRIKTAQQELLLKKLKGDLEDAQALIKTSGAKLIEMGHVMMA